jgi:hypothetical protein
VVLARYMQILTLAIPHRAARSSISTNVFVGMAGVRIAVRVGDRRRYVIALAH